jgi:Tol biopolymer transport system component
VPAWAWALGGVALLALVTYLAGASGEPTPEVIEVEKQVTVGRVVTATSISTPRPTSTTSALISSTPRASASPTKGSFPYAPEIFAGELKKAYTTNPDYPNDRTVEIIDLYVQCLTCDEPDFQVTKGDGNYDSPVWSPDGTMIAVLRGSDCWSQELVIISSDGSWQQVIKRLDPFCRVISWSPSGREIAFNALDGSLKAVDLNTEQTRTIVPAALIQRNSEDINSVKWSPDGSQLAFWTRMAEEPNDETGWEIWVVNADGSALRNLRAPEENYGQIGVQWTLDSSRIVYTRLEMIGYDERGDRELWVMNSNGENRHRVDDSISVKKQIYYPGDMTCYGGSGICGEYSWGRD